MSKERELFDGDLNGAPLRPGGQHDDDDTQPELEKRQIRRRLQVALEAADALDRAVRAGVVSVRFAEIEDEDPLEMSLVLWGGLELDRLNPVFHFNLRDAFQEATRDSDYAMLERYRRIADALDVLVAEMRAQLATPEEIEEYRRLEEGELEEQDDEAEPTS